MTWIKDRNFFIGLSVGTLLLVAGSVWYGKAGASRYEEAKSTYESAAADAANFENLPLYPTKENFDSKKLALDEYSASTKALQEAFGKYRSDNLPGISPQDLSDQMKAAHDETRKAFGQLTELPEDYYCGFNAYRSKVARGEATGILSYQLGIVKQMMLDLAAAQPTKLIGIHRPELAEETGKEQEVGKDDVARSLPIEVTFQGSEKAVRQFFSSIANTDNRYLVIRSQRIKNIKQDPPRSTDAQFERPAPAAASGGNAAPAAVGLVPDFDGDAAETAASKPTPEAAPAPVDTSRILSQVLGNEELSVFLRLDIMQFLPAKQTP